VIETILHYATTNPILIGGIGTVVFGSVMYIIRDIPRRVYGVIKRMTTIEISLTSDSFLYHEILGVLSAARVTLFARNYSTDHEGDVVSGFGNSIAIFERRLVTFNRELIEKNMRLDEKIHITVFSRNVGILRSMIAKARLPKRDDMVKIYMAPSSYWHSPVKRRKRGLDTIFVNGGTKNIVIDKIKWFLANEQWYIKRGIPYKLVFLLHGEPGTGKSSLVYGIASHFDRGIGAISSISGIDDTLKTLPENTFALIEDIDMISISRDDDDDEKPGTPVPPHKPDRDAQTDRQLSALQVLINALDGIGTPHGLIIFITTNFRDRLDAALIRPGRVDCDLRITPLEKDATEEMFVAFYGSESRSLIRAYTTSSFFKPRPGAVLQQLFMTETPDRAIANLRGHPDLHTVAARGEVWQ
jgi:chaperone BCS1